MKYNETNQQVDPIAIINKAYDINGASKNRKTAVNKLSGFKENRQEKASELPEVYSTNLSKFILKTIRLELKLEKTTKFRNIIECIQKPKV